MVTESFRRLKQWTSRQFYWFGLHCAKHTMVVLLTSGVVITVLVYPALFIQFDANSNRSSTSAAARLRGGGAWSTFFSNPRSYSSYSGLVAAPLVREVWEGHDALRLREDATVVARCGVQSTIAIERLFVRGYSSDDTSGNGVSPIPGPIPALKDSRRTLQNIERYLQIQAPHSLLECIKDASGRCFITSPIVSTSHHDYDPNTDREEITFRNTLANPPPIAGIPLHVDSIVARHSNNYGSGSVPDDLVNDSEYLVLTFALKVDSGDCQSTTRHLKWLDLLRTTVGPNGVVTPTSSLPYLFALEHDPSGSRSSFSRFSALIYLIYVVIFVYFSGSLRQIDTLHDRFGMAFTGIVEIIMSTLCSISVCEIIGFQLNMVPPEILPVIIVFVGAENMFTMVEDVVTTRITLPVKERIGIGLSKSGTSNTIKVVSYNALLGTIAFFATGAIHQFCVFAIVVLVIHWIHINTMFIGVLAIDLHRLELSDHLSQNTMMESSGPNGSSASSASLSTKAKTAVKTATSSGFRGTAATNGSLLLMLALAGALYYTTYSGSKASLTVFATGGPENDTYSRAMNTSHLGVAPDPAMRLWNLFNPAGDKFLHVKIEPPAFVTFSPDGGVLARSRLPERGHRPPLMQWIIGPLLQLWKTIIVPSFATNFLLWLILRYLMRDAELIEAQRHREDGDDASLLEGGGRNTERTPPLNSPGVSSSGNGVVSYKQLERACANDIILVASSSDALVIAALSTEHELAVWFDRDGRHASINCAPLLRPAMRASTSTTNGTNGTNGANVSNSKHRATQLALDSRGAWCALATDGGLLVIWSLAKGSAVLQCRALVAPGSSPGIPIRNMIFMSPASSLSTSRSTSASPLISSQQNRAPASQNVTLVITDARGNVYTWPFLTSPVPTVMATKSRETPESRGSSISSLGEHALGQSTAAPSAVPCANGADVDTGRYLCAKSVPVRGEMTLVVASVSSTNTFFLTNTSSGEKICIIDDPLFQSHDTSVDRARIGVLDARSCRTCSGTKPATIVFSASSKGVVHVYHIPSPGANGGMPCSCSQQDLFERSARPRRPSHTATPVVTPLKMRRKTSSTSSISQDSPPSPTSKDYPMYGHGVHSRREKTRDFSDDFLVPPPHLTNGDVQLVDMSNPLHKMIKIAMISCDRGGWDMCGGAVIGVRKRTRRSSLPPKSVDAYVATLRGEFSTQHTSRTLTPFENWEVWVSDSTGTLRTTSIVDLPPIPKGLIPIDEDDNRNGLFFHPPLSPTLPNITSIAISETVPRVRVYPRIPFTRVSCFAISSSGEYCLVGFGNTALVISIPRDLDSSTNAARPPVGSWTPPLFSFLSGSNTL